MSSSHESEGSFLDEYIHPKKSKGRYFLSLVLILVFALIVFLLIQSSGKRISVEELKASIELHDIESIWIENGKIDDGESEKIILVPTISFKIRNVGKIDLKYVSIVGVFRFYRTDKHLGEGNKMVLKDGLKPGESSDRIRIVSDRGYRATSVDAFVSNSKEWQTTYVNIFAKMAGYKHVLIKRFNISRRIKGMNLNIKIDDPEIKKLLESSNGKVL